MIFLPHNVPSSKNGKRWTGRYMVWSKVSERYRKETKGYFLLFKEDFLREVEGLPKPYHIKFTFVRDSRRKFDYPNPLQTIMDLMVENRWLEDDNADEILPIFGEYKYSKLDPGVFIEVIK